MSRRVAIFDVEGTLVDSVVPTLACWREVLAAHGFHFSLAELHRHSGRDPDDMIADLLGAAQGARLGETLKKEHGERYRAHFLAVTVGFAEVRRLFETLRKSDWSTALATSCGRGELSHYLALLGIEELVDANCVRRGRKAPKASSRSGGTRTYPHRVPAQCCGDGGRYTL